MDPRLAASLEQSLEKALHQAHLDDLLRFAKIAKHWEVIIGHPLCTKTKPALLSKKTLEVWVQEASYAEHLRYFERNILDLIASAAILGPNQVFRVKFKVGPIERAHALTQQRLTQLPEYRPPSPQAQEAAQAKTAPIQDPNLRRALRRYMARHLDMKTP